MGKKKKWGKRASLQTLGTAMGGKLMLIIMAEEKPRPSGEGEGLCPKNLKRAKK